MTSQNSWSSIRSDKLLASSHKIRSWMNSRTRNTIEAAWWLRITASQGGQTKPRASRIFSRVTPNNIIPSIGGSRAWKTRRHQPRRKQGAHSTRGTNPWSTSQTQASGIIPAKKHSRPPPWTWRLYGRVIIIRKDTCSLDSSQKLTDLAEKVQYHWTQITKRVTKIQKYPWKKSSGK